ncbi:hypothetical protein HYX01_01670 [Candidatus Woesearchaeota archaeon]|nr:hypothetical protein [Candidatus Woesearchaeota archaeon]
MDKEIAKKVLSDVNAEQCFWVNNGAVLKNLEELYQALSKMKKETYIYHANKEKNDFSNWAKDVLNDDKLADELLKVKSRTNALSKVKQRIQYLKKTAEI